jgi:predicted nucleotidyltransferase
MNNNQNFNLEMILNKVNKHIGVCTEDFFNKEDFQPTFICLVGSRVEGTNKEYSDLDIAIQYTGDARECDVYHALNSVPLKFDEFVCDFIALSEENGSRIDLSRAYIVLYDLDDYDPKKMERFIEKDGLLKFAFKDLMRRNHSKDDAARLVFNSYVLGDSVMEAEYNKL